MAARQEDGRPGEDKDGRFVGDQVEALDLLVRAPADPAFPRPALEGVVMPSGQG